eukprot:6903139-Alexandrium_andersonii.AAC.1
MTQHRQTTPYLLSAIAHHTHRARGPRALFNANAPQIRASADRRTRERTHTPIPTPSWPRAQSAPPATERGQGPTLTRPHTGDPLPAGAGGQP